jgi:hypothetical protein
MDNTVDKLSAGIQLSLLLAGLSFGTCPMSLTATAYLNIENYGS